MASPPKLPGTTFPPEIEKAAVRNTVPIPPEFERHIFARIEGIGVSDDVPGFTMPSDVTALIFVTHGGSREHIFLLNDEAKQAILQSLAGGIHVVR